MCPLFDLFEWVGSASSWCHLVMRGEGRDGVRKGVGCTSHPREVWICQGWVGDGDQENHSVWFWSVHANDERAFGVPNSPNPPQDTATRLGYITTTNLINSAPKCTLCYQKTMSKMTMPCLGSAIRKSSCSGTFRPFLDEQGRGSADSRWKRVLIHRALTAPGYFPDWHIGVRAQKSGKLVAFISGIKVDIRVREK